MAINDIYRLKLSGNFLGQTVNNIFHFENVVANLTAVDLNSGFMLNVLPYIRAVCSTNMTYTDIEIVNLSNGSDFYTNTFGENGTRVGGDDAPPFVAWAFSLNPNRIDRRAGAKRFAGIREGDIVSGVNTGAILGPLDDLAIALGNPIFVLAGRFTPVLKSIRCVKDPVTNKCTSAFIISYPRISSANYDSVSTQSSRKFGYGV